MGTGGKPTQLPRVTLVTSPKVHGLMHLSTPRVLMCAAPSSIPTCTKTQEHWEKRHMRRVSALMQRGKHQDRFHAKPPGQDAPHASGCLAACWLRCVRKPIKCNCCTPKFQADFFSFQGAWTWVRTRVITTSWAKKQIKSRLRAHLAPFHIAFPQHLPLSSPAAIKTQPNFSSFFSTFSARQQITELEKWCWKRRPILRL